MAPKAHKIKKQKGRDRFLAPRILIFFWFTGFKIRKRRKGRGSFLVPKVFKLRNQKIRKMKGREKKPRKVHR